MKKYFVMTAIALAVVGCASGPNKLVETPKVSINDRVPEWFTSEPAKDSKDIVVTATDTSREMQFAIDKAMMNARIELGSRINIKVQSVMTETVDESGAGKMKDVEREIDRVSKTVTNQSLSLYTREKLFVVKEDDGFRAYVMLKINGDESRKLIDRARKGASNPKDQRDRKLQELEDI